MGEHDGHAGVAVLYDRYLGMPAIDLTTQIGSDGIRYATGTQPTSDPESGREDSPAREAYAVTPSDSAELPWPSRALVVGVSGVAAVVTAGGDGTSVNIPVQAGWNPIQVTKVLATGTTATDIVAVR